jgi:hypothetical protein
MVVYKGLTIKPEEIIQAPQKKFWDFRHLRSKDVPMLALAV